MSETEPEVTAEQLKEKEIEKYVKVLTMSFMASQGEDDLQEEFFCWYISKNPEELSADFISQNATSIEESFLEKQAARLTQGTSHKVVRNVDFVKIEASAQLEILAAKIENNTQFDCWNSAKELLKTEIKYQGKGRKKSSDGEEQITYNSLFRDFYLSREVPISPIAEFYKDIFLEVDHEKNDYPDFYKKVVQNMYIELKEKYEQRHPGEQFDPLGKLAFLEE